MRSSYGWGRRMQLPPPPGGAIINSDQMVRDCQSMKTLSLFLLSGLIFGSLAFERRSNSNSSAPRLDAALPVAVANEQVSASKNQEPAEQQPQDFDARCHAPGVLVCQGFDSPLITITAKWPAPGLYPAWDGTVRGTFDRAQKASGEGSLRFEIPSHSSANAAGYWRQPFGRNFGQGSTFYVQFRERFSPEMLTNNLETGHLPQRRVHMRRGGADDRPVLPQRIPDHVHRLRRPKPGHQ